MSEIIMPRGLKSAELVDKGGVGSRRHSHVGSKGDLRVELHYIGPTEHRLRHERQAALYIYKITNARHGVFVPFRGMWEYAQAGAMEKVVLPLARHLYGDPPAQWELHRTLDAVMDYLEDLKNHPPETGLDISLDQFLEECDDEGLEFFVEVNGQRVI